MAMTLLTRPKKTVATITVAQDGSGDTTDIQTGIDLLPAGGGVVYIREGTYTIYSTITIRVNNTALIGAGRSTQIIVSSLISCDAIIISNIDGILIENLYIYGCLVAGSSGIRMHNSANSLINHCWIENCAARGMNISSSHNNTISNNFIYSNVGTGIYFLAEQHSIITGNQIYENGWNGIFLYNSDDCIITENEVVDNDVNNLATYDGIGIGSDSDNNIITNNRCKDNDRYEINIIDNTCDKNLILGNICVGTDHVGAINDGGTGTVGLATNSLHSIVA